MWYECSLCSVVWDAYGSGYVIYQEPEYAVMERIEGIEHTAKVLMPQDVSATTEDNKKKRVALMAIEPDEFGQVCWSNRNLLPTHINNYLNLMTYSKNAAIVSRAIADEMGVETGDIAVVGNNVHLPAGVTVKAGVQVDETATF